MVRSISEQSFRTLFDKKYIKIFALGIILLILGIILVMTRNLYSVFTEVDTAQEAENYIRTLGVIGTISGFFIESGMLLVALSTFIGGIVDDSLAPEVKRGMIFATSIAIIALALIIIFQGIIII